ncbi:hypothetical protein N8314_00815 [Akkermansiaceae bacterium]|nr:hypothetical protein [Akkermansiaceae bacterium]
MILNGKELIEYTRKCTGEDWFLEKYLGDFSGMFVRSNKKYGGIERLAFDMSDMILSEDLSHNTLEDSDSFELDEEIEVSYDKWFKVGIYTGSFKHLDPEGDHWVADKSGYMQCGRYARKIEPKVYAVFFANEYDAVQTGCEYSEVSKELSDKIKRGDV